MFRWWEQIISQHCRRGQLCAENRQWVITLCHSLAFLQYCIVIRVYLIHTSVCLFIISGGTVQSKSYSFTSSTSSSSNTSKKVGRSVMKHQHSNYIKFKFPALSQMNLPSFPQCVWSRGWPIISQWQRRAGCRGAEAGGEAQGADEGSDSAKDLCHASP